MTKEEYIKKSKQNEMIVEGNEVIAKFLGWENTGMESLPLWTRHNVIKSSDEFDYHSSFDSLLIVILEIGRITEYELVIHSGECYWNKWGNNPLGKEYPGYSYPLVLGIWQAVVDFIEWYNSVVIIKHE